MFVYQSLGPFQTYIKDFLVRSKLKANGVMQTDMETCRHSDRHSDRHADLQTYRHTDTLTEWFLVLHFAAKKGGK